MTTAWIASTHTPGTLGKCKLAGNCHLDVYGDCILERRPPPIAGLHMKAAWTSSLHTPRTLGNCMPAVKCHSDVHGDRVRDQQPPPKALHRSILRLSGRRGRSRLHGRRGCRHSQLQCRGFGTRHRLVSVACASRCLLQMPPNHRSTMRCRGC